MKNKLNNNLILTKSVYKTHRKIPGTYTNETFYGAYGYIANSSRQLYIFIPMVFSNNVSSIEVTSLSCSLRLASGGLIGVGTGTNYYFDMTEYVNGATLKLDQGIIRVSVLKPKDDPFIKYTENEAPSTSTKVTNTSPFIGNVKLSYILS